MKVWVPDYYDGRLGALPPEIELEAFPDDPLGAADIGEVEFAVPPHRPREVLEALPRMRRLRVLQTDSAGVDWLSGHVPAGVTLCNARGVHDVAVAEWIVAAVLAQVKRLPEAFESQRAGRWERHDPDELAGKTVLIVGYGSIGHAVAARLESFGVRLLALARTARHGVLGAERLHSVLPEADAVVVLAPLTEETRGLVDRDFLEQMRPGALLVNASRGAVVDTDALLRALREGKVRAALDVTEPEPLPDDHPLWRAEGVLITAHVAGESPFAIERAAALIREQLLRLLDGRPLLNVLAAR